ncbi:hypothetical protein GCM10007071_02770 [Marinobacter zhanjiangensis]|uniref:DUF2798 domain-containing protein n=1 Tax=Marinobacter zhanjiangensis TaxID=578215 RepID=A0ABQ3ALP1_9GAMM|nr:hypothetical protein GCM10007071_02770 [Marinobacter zhanjiangensis]
MRVQQLVFAFYMSGIMSLLMSGVITGINTGLTGSFVKRWLAAWLIAWAVAFPLVIFVAPLARRMTEATSRWLGRFGPGDAE